MLSLKKNTWPHDSRKYLLLALIWSAIAHIAVFLLAGNTDWHTGYSGDKNLQTVYIAENKSPGISNNPPTEDTATIKNLAGAKTNQASSPASVPQDGKTESSDRAYDTPATAISALPDIAIENEPETLDPDQPLFVIRLWIDDTGLVSRTEILASQLNAAESARLASEFGQLFFVPAQKNQKSVASTKAYASGLQSSE